MSTPINLYAYVMDRFDRKCVPQRTVSVGSGVPFSTVSKIAQRSVLDPSVHTVQKIYDYFWSLDHASDRQGCSSGD